MNSKLIYDDGRIAVFQRGDVIDICEENIGRVIMSVECIKEIAKKLKEVKA